MCQLSKLLFIDSKTWHSFFEWLALPFYIFGRKKYQNSCKFQIALPRRLFSELGSLSQIVTSPSVRRDPTSHPKTFLSTGPSIPTVRRDPTFHPETFLSTGPSIPTVVQFMASHPLTFPSINHLLKKPPITSPLVRQVLASPLVRQVPASHPGTFGDMSNNFFASVSKTPGKK